MDADKLVNCLAQAWKSNRGMEFDPFNVREGYIKPEWKSSSNEDIYVIVNDVLTPIHNNQHMPFYQILKDYVGIVIVSSNEQLQYAYVDCRTYRETAMSLLKTTLTNFLLNTLNND